MFSRLSEKLEQTFKRLRGKGKLTETDVNEAMREIRVALLEADVNLGVVRDFIGQVKSRSIGAEVLESLTPGQQVVKIVHNQLISLLGGTQSKITVASQPPTVIMLVGLQGSGKTTTAAKLANWLRNSGRRPMLAACDIYRPAAVRQLQVLAEKLSMPVTVATEPGMKPPAIARLAVTEAAKKACDTVILDTAGRLHIDELLMQELAEIRRQAKPHEVLLVIDAMIGQDAVAVAESFNNQIGIDGVIVTKLDGDARGGAVLSVRAVTGRPVKMVGVGEKIEDFQPFFPDRMASRILGMGDVLSLIDRAEQVFDEKKAGELARKMRREQFTLDDFLDQLQQLKKLGPLESLIGMLPGMGKMKEQLKRARIDHSELKKIEAIIRSMTANERADSSIINGSRRRRIAAGSGTRVQDVNRLLRQFGEAKKMMKRLQNLPAGRGKGGFNLPFFGN
ncbi:MAG: signal recognition particle protein [Negativicutes bacterium]|nr:signal recognition particle protein [Negativicutes bacterium]